MEGLEKLLAELEELRALMDEQSRALESKLSEGAMAACAWRARRINELITEIGRRSGADARAETTFDDEDGDEPGTMIN